MALNITRGMVFKPQKVIVYGPEGIGKSTFAAKFPDPLFIDTEGSTNLLDVARLPKPSSWTMMIQMISEVKNTPGCCKTLIIDTIDWAEQLCVKHVCATYDKKGIEDFGYGKGYIYVKEEFGRLLNLLSDVTEAGINVVLTAHSLIRKFELPDECGSFDRYELKLGNKTGSQTSALVKEWADMVLFANYRQRVVEVDKKKKAQGGMRIMYTQHHPCWDAKNRHDLKEELPFEYEQIGYCIPNDSSQEPEPIKDVLMTQSHAVPSPEPATEQKTKNEVKNNAAAQTEEKNTTTKLQNKAVDQKKDIKPLPENIPKSLADLMIKNNVTVEEIQEIVSDKGYYPKDTLISNYDPGFIEGCLVGAWDQVFAAIKELREVPF
ncbi:ATP-binding protein [Anaerosinus massiliensis]|uniref:ATP-binding protein n=1 Tax=Massilibacillus massiliensis TaxID=1806837 RepID=UPI000AF7567F|nr:ATP-binding protein [Massilibacillus massiliensis]